MGVFAEHSRDAIAGAVVGWGRGLLVELEPTALGIENSNFFVTTEDGDGEQHALVLTILEQPATATSLDLLDRLAAVGLPVPAPLRNLDGERVGQVESAPALLAPRLAGSHPDVAGTAHCRAIGDFLGRMHATSARMKGPAHPRDAAWMDERVRQSLPALGLADRERMIRARDGLHAAAARLDRLPQGLVHGDLFRDNALFDGEQLTGVIDFHHAARAPLAFDLAVVAQDWCTDADGHVDRERLVALLDGYGRRRPLTQDELVAWPLLLVLATLRFWLARLASPRKPPQEMAARLASALDRPCWLSEGDVRVVR